ncbi:MAG TPA: CRISPR-associated endonuclease Cas1 [Silvibacterium sp.]|nr:CRISPR-associated endonuclease Cas1 [Silvibacterium sp.]
MADESFWQARSVAEHAYCPRLFYYMAVEGTFLPSADTEAGTHVHRRVDRPSKTDDNDDEPVDDGRPKVVRSLALTSHTLGLTATLDLAEISGQVAVPIEYRKGRPKRQVMAPPPDDPGEAEQPPLSHPEPWPTDRAQIGLQVLLLEEAHYTVPHAVFYYAAEKLRLTIPVDDALRAEALATLEAAKQCATGPRPMPLINDSRCVRCSLQPICLPDEVNQQRLEQITARQIWPLRDEGIHLVAQKEGARVGVRGAAMRITDKDGIVVRDVPLANVETLALLGSVQLSTQAIQVLADRSIPIAFLSAAGRLIAMIDPLDSVSAEVRRAQVRRFDDPQATLALARAVIAAKIVNQRTLLQRNHSELPESVSSDLADEASKAAQAESMASVRGHEGQAAAIYFEHFSGMFKGAAGAEFDKHGRQRRPPPDPINACISMAYTMLTHECVAALRQARLEPSIGAFHVSRPGRPALALDLMEPFRPLIGDSVAVAAFNRGELTDGHFMRTASGCMLTDAGRRAFFGAWGRRMDVEITHPVFKYRLSYRRMLVLHARMIAAWLLGEVPSLSFLTTR